MTVEKTRYFATKHPRPRIISAVYFLYAGNEVVYVGSTVNLASRLTSSDHQSKSWDSYSFLPVPPGRLRAKEKVYIRQLLPKLNVCAFSQRLRGPKKRVERNARRRLRNTLEPVFEFDFGSPEQIRDTFAEIKRKATCKTKAVKSPSPTLL